MTFIVDGVHVTFDIKDGRRSYFDHTRTCNITPYAYGMGTENTGNCWRLCIIRHWVMANWPQYEQISVKPSTVYSHGSK